LKKGILLAALVAVTAFSMKSAIACDQHGITGILPENNMRISVFQKFGVSGIDEKGFNAIIDRVSQFYAPIIQQKGGILKVNRLWTNDTVNASANRNGKYWELNMYGGLARHEAITEDGFMLVVCHELGHHLGGAPKYSGMNWAANEGQADYFGVLKCMKRVLSVENNIAVMANRPIEPTVKASCDRVFRDDQERALCSRIGMAGKSLADLFASFGGSAPKFETPDKTVVKVTYDAHPKSQCRLDTYFQGTLCPRAFLDDVSETDPTRGVCTKADGFTFGTRPLCWYKPGPNE
jgi:hypothetical protein